MGSSLQPLAGGARPVHSSNSARLSCAVAATPSPGSAQQTQNRAVPGPAPSPASRPAQRGWEGAEVPAARTGTRAVVALAGFTEKAVKREVCLYYHYFSFLSGFMLPHSCFFFFKQRNRKG